MLLHYSLPKSIDRSIDHKTSHSLRDRLTDHSLSDGLGMSGGHFVDCDTVNPTQNLASVMAHITEMASLGQKFVPEGPGDWERD